LPSTLSISKALQLIKGGSSKWVHDTSPEHRLFNWQIKHGAFGVSESLLDKTIAYIKAQEQPHRKMTFQMESWRCSRNTEFNLMSVICEIEGQPSLRDWEV